MLLGLYAVDSKRFQSYILTCIRENKSSSNHWRYEMFRMVPAVIISSTISSMVWRHCLRDRVAAALGFEIVKQKKA